MAYAAIISLKLTLQNILLHPHRYSIPCDKEHIESFHEKLEVLQRFLEEYPAHKSNEKVTSLERRIRDAAYEAEDFMDLHLNNLSDSEELMGQINIELMMKKVDSIIEQAIEIKEQMGLEVKPGRGSFMDEEIKTGEFGKHKDLEPPNAFRKDSSSAIRNLMVGFDDHLMQIKDQLTGQSSALEVISIVGMGGIGKTTLATHVYNDPSLEYQFDIRAWATISQSYCVRDILLGMLDSMKILTKEMNRESDDQLGLHVYRKLKYRRYLIILDDIWDSNAWDYLKILFPNDETGSRIMLTTRIEDVALYASPYGTLHHISLLSDDQSWKLLCAKVFGNEPCPLNLKEIGMTIACNCRGLPLSIVVIGGLLSKVEKTHMAWQPVAENVTSFVFSSDDKCSDILRLSYNYLPQHLKACFLYMGVFPKTHEILVSRLSKMWVAEGFLRQGDGQSPEEVAERCVEDLFDRSLIVLSKKNYDGKIKAFRIHDLLLDFCVKEAKDEKFLQIVETNLFPTSSVSERRISINHPVAMFSWSHFVSMPYTSYVRSFVSEESLHISPNLFLGFKLLRVLDASQLWFEYFPPHVLELLNLRYIALFCDGDIPASITKLWNLQTLIILRGQNYGICGFLPIWNMTHLRHVRCDGAFLLGPLTDKFNCDEKHLVLGDLQTLSGIWNLRFTKVTLQRIPNIEKIDVSYDFSLFKTDYQLENLGQLHQLKALKIRVASDLNLTPILKFRFPPSLKTLTLDRVGIPWDDLVIMGSLPNLEVLKLKNSACRGTEWEPNEGEFCKLKALVLQNLELEHWRADSIHFPSLECLIIRWCDELVEIPSGIGEIPTLATIGLHQCKASVMASANEILERQQSYGNDGFQVINAEFGPRPLQVQRLTLLAAFRYDLVAKEIIGEGTPTSLNVMSINKCEQLMCFPSFTKIIN